MTDSIEFSLKSGIAWGNKVVTSNLQSAWHSSQGRTACAAVQPLLVVRERQWAWTHPSKQATTPVWSPSHTIIIDASIKEAYKSWMTSNISLIGAWGEPHSLRESTISLAAVRALAWIELLEPFSAGIALPAIVIERLATTVPINDLPYFILKV